MNEQEFDIKKHVLVPEHTKLTEEEKEQLLEKFKTTIYKLPKITIKDPAIQELNPQIGEIIKITRNSPTAEKTVYYRVVING